MLADIDPAVVAPDHLRRADLGHLQGRRGAMGARFANMWKSMSDQDVWNKSIKCCWLDAITVKEVNLLTNLMIQLTRGEVLPAIEVPR